jgi:putative cardiolipin synthase
MRLKLLSLVLCALLEQQPMDFIHAQIAAHAGESGAYILDTGDEALIARAWLADHARTSIDVQYFIWSTDNIGILAAEALLRAAERGVRVRIIVDDLLMKAPPQSLLALDRHPNIDIRIYNPKWSDLNLRGFNQRMHDKVLVVDGVVAITGGRNMAGEYYDYNHEYNFRDRDALVVGDVVKAMQASFDRFWQSKLSVKVEDLFHDLKDVNAQNIYRTLHRYASAPENFAPSVRTAIDAAPSAFPRLTREMVWGDVEFIGDRPGKNDSVVGLGGGGLTTAALAHLVEGARQRVVIQSPYLVLSDEAKALFRRARARGVRVRIDTNSLASTDNLQAFSGYRSQRAELLRMGLEIFEFKPRGKSPIVGLHAKSLVVDSRVVYVGTFNLDPRSQNLNTEVGVIIRNEALARRVEAAIEKDIATSWNAATDHPDESVPFAKRNKVRLWQLLPLKPIL